MTEPKDVTINTTILKLLIAMSNSYPAGPQESLMKSKVIEKAQNIIDRANIKPEDVLSPEEMDEIFDEFER